MMHILGLVGMYFDAAVVFVTNSSLLFRLAKAMLCTHKKQKHILFPIIDLVNLTSFNKFYAQRALSI